MRRTLPSAVGGQEGTEASLSWSFGDRGNPGSMHAACTQSGKAAAGKCLNRASKWGEASREGLMVYLATHSEKQRPSLAENKSLLLSDLGGSVR